MPSLLVIMIFLPAIAAVALLLLDPQATAVRARWVALLATVATFLVSWGVAAQFLALPQVSETARGPVHPQLVQRHTWLDLSQAGPHSPGVKLEFFLGLDGIVIKSHGGADAIGFCGAIETGYQMVRHELLHRIRDALAHAQEARLGAASVLAAEPPATETH